MTSPKSLIINSPYDRPLRHWQQGTGTQLNLVEGRRAAAYEVIDTRNNTRRIESLDTVNRIRERAKFPGAKVTTIDGVRADYKDGFGLVRCSNTTPCLVLRFDALNKNRLDRIQDSFRGQLLALDPKINLPF
jgi:phosphomannomutase